jgi:LPS export ABC transporter permease LptG
LDLYLVRGVAFFFLLLTGALLLLFGLFTVLEMVDDIAAHNIPWSVVGRFLWYLLPQAFYLMAPLGLLLGILVHLALLSKRHELVAIKGAGISLYRIALPVVLLGLACSTLLFWFDQHYLPAANQQQEILRNQIKGRPPQTFFHAERRWIFGEQPRIYHYSFFDPDEKLLGRLNVFELDPATFSLRRRLYARRAHWEPDLSQWVLEQGWERSFQPDQTVRYRAFDAASFPELTEAPAYFRKEVRESQQMSWRELGGYIDELQQSGFEVTRLRVQWHKKFAFPLIATFIALLAFPFGAAMGGRGALGALALGIGLGFFYWVLAGFFEAVGNIALLPPLLAAWAPNVIFGFGGLYFFLRLET